MKNKKIKIVLSDCEFIDSNTDADDIGHKITECVKHLETDKEYINLVKLHVAEGVGNLCYISEQCYGIKKLLSQCGVDNAVVIPVGGDLPVKDITVERIEITDG